MNKLFAGATLLAGLALFQTASAQEQATTANSNGSYRPIPPSDMMFRKTVWRGIDLREKQNLPLYSEGKEISRIIIEAVKRGELQAYRSDSLTSTLTPAEVSTNMSIAQSGGGAPPPDDSWGASGGDGWGGTSTKPKATTRKEPILGANGKPKKDKNGKIMYRTVTVEPTPAAAPPVVNNEVRYKDLYQIELKEDMIFDKKRSRMYHDIKSITLFVPASLPANEKGFDIRVATFKYSDLVKVFRANPEKAIWFNPQNDAQHKNLADAFELWLFHSYITKVSNPRDQDLASTYGDKRGILASSQAASDLIDYEYSLWSF